MPLLPGLPPLEITLRRSARARRFSLRVSRLDGRVTLTVPPRAREAEAMTFARGHEGWLRETLDALPLGETVTLGTLLPVEGRALRLVPGTGREALVERDVLVIPGAPGQVGTRARAFLRLLARDRLAAASDRHAAALGLPYAGLALRDTRSRWGSCTTGGRLMYSWRLIMAPPAVLDYVAAHEVAHLAEMNHAPAFWAVVARLCPGFAPHRAWLREHGQTLHGFRFDAPG